MQQRIELRHYQDKSRQTIVLPYSVKKSCTVQFGPFTDEISLSVKGFPTYQNVVLSLYTAFATAKLGLYAETYSQLKTIDPLIMASDMDNQTLRDLDIEQTTDVYSIN